eukprot:3579231-Karenia_brevis.AAC.1
MTQNGATELAESGWLNIVGGMVVAAKDDVGTCKTSSGRPIHQHRLCCHTDKQSAGIYFWLRRGDEGTVQGDVFTD